MVMGVTIQRGTLRVVTRRWVMARAIHAGDTRRGQLMRTVWVCEGMRHCLDSPAEKQPDDEQERNQGAL